MQQSSLFERMRKTAWQTTSRGLPPATEEHQMSARLHCLYGRPIHKGGRTRSNRSYPYACSRVYDMRLYTPHTMWGPFRDDTTRRVDWEKVEAISIILSHNVRSQWPRTDIFDDLWDTPFYGSFPRSYVPATVPRGLTDLDARDPYGVTGSWYRVSSVPVPLSDPVLLPGTRCSHKDRLSASLTTPTSSTTTSPWEAWSPTTRPGRPSVSARQPGSSSWSCGPRASSPPGPTMDRTSRWCTLRASRGPWITRLMIMPTLVFEVCPSQSRSEDGSHPTYTSAGLVRLTKEGEVWWTTNSVFHGQERWRSESIQVGGVRSARGNVGTWFDRYD